MIALTGKQKSHLRSLAMKEKPLFQIGKEGLTDALLQAIDAHIRKNELTKITVLGTADIAADAIAAAFAKRGIAIVQTIGKTVVLYRPNPERDRRIILPE